MSMRTLPVAFLAAGCATATMAGPAAIEASPQAALQSFRGLHVNVLPDSFDTSLPAGNRIESFVARATSLGDVLTTLFKDSDVNVFIDETSAALPATFDIKNASLEEALDTILTTNDLTYRWDGTFLRVSRRERAVFDVDFPSGEGSLAGGAETGGAESAAPTAVGGTTSGQARSAAAAAAFWRSLRADLEALTRGDEGIVLLTNPTLGTVMVDGRPSSVRRVEAYLDNARRRATQLVSIEARILEVSLSEDFQLGVDYSLLPGLFNSHEPDRQGTLPGGAVISQSLSAGVGNLRFGFINTNQFSILVDMLQAQGQVRVLSNPRVSTLNNVPATIRVVQQVPVIEREIIDSQGTSRTQFSVRFEDAGVAVSVTPQVAEDGVVTVHVAPSITEVTGFVSTPDNLVTEPILSTRNVEAILRIADGQAAVIGGLRSTRKTEELSSVPFLGSIPGLGALFRTTRQSSAETELVVVVHPRVLSAAWLREDIDRGLERVLRARVPFKFGPIGMQEDERSWGQPHLGGQPASGDPAAAPLLVRAAPPPEGAKALSRTNLARLSFGRAVRHLEHGNETQGWQDLDEALALDDRRPEAWLLRGTLERRRGNDAAARRSLERAQELAPDHPLPRNSLGLIELDAGNPVAAEGHFRAAAQRADLAPLQNNLGVAFLQQGRMPEAAAAFRAAATKDKDLAEAHANLGVCLELQGDVPGAAQAYRAFLLAGGDIEDPRLRALRASIRALADRQP
jgi:MSHA biogenesis protein MshL